MAALPTNSTDRLVADYSWRGRVTKVMYRFRAPTTLAGFVTALNAFHTAIKPGFYTNWLVLGSAVIYNEGQDYSTPVSGVTATAGTFNTDPANHSDAYQVRVEARSAGGRKANWSFLGFKYLNDPNQRVEGSADAQVQALLTAFVALRSAGLVTINGLTPAFKPYVNLTYNDYLTAQSRAG